jgi:hypothetical protein
MDPGEIGWVDMNWLGLTQDGDQRSAVRNTVTNFRVI